MHVNLVHPSGSPSNSSNSHMLCTVHVCILKSTGTFIQRQNMKHIFSGMDKYIYLNKILIESTCRIDLHKYTQPAQIGYNPKPRMAPQKTTLPHQRETRAESDTMLATAPSITTTTNLNTITHARHLTLNHAPLARLADIARRGTIAGFTRAEIKTTFPLTYSACADGKGTKRLHPRTTHTQHCSADVIRSDKLGPIHPHPN